MLLGTFHFVQPLEPEVINTIREYPQRRREFELRWLKAIGFMFPGFALAAMGSEGVLPAPSFRVENGASPAGRVAGPAPDCPVA